MKTEIFYFSGTGNSLYIARKIAGRFHAALTPLASFYNCKTYSTDADRIGFVFPVYYGRLPAIVRNFLQILDGLKGKYVFAAANFGGSASRSLTEFKKIVKQKGGFSFAGFAVHMPQNAFLKPWEKKEMIWAKAAQRIDFIVKNIESKKKGIFYTNLPLELCTAPLPGLIQKSLKEKFISLSHASGDLSLENLMHLSDNSYRANEKCKGCGICREVCPVGNIKLAEGRPVWLNRCETCLACYNFCPNKAIEGGVVQTGHYYRYPEIRAADMKVKEKIQM